MSETTEKLEDSLVAEIVKRDIDNLCQQKKIRTVCTDSTDIVGMVRRMVNLSDEEAAIYIQEHEKDVAKKALQYLKKINKKKGNEVQEALIRVKMKISAIIRPLVSSS